MRTVLGLLAALTLAVGLTVTAPTPAHAVENWRAMPGACSPACPIATMAVNIKSHQINSTQWVIDQIDMGCNTNCPFIGNRGFFDLGPRIRGNSGTLWSRTNVDVGIQCCISFFPNIKVGTSAQFFMDYGYIDKIGGGTYTNVQSFQDCAPVRPGGPDGRWGCVSVHNL